MCMQTRFVYSEHIKSFLRSAIDVSRGGCDCKNIFCAQPAHKVVPAANHGCKKERMCLCTCKQTHFALFLQHIMDAKRRECACTHSNKHISFAPTAYRSVPAAHHRCKEKRVCARRMHPTHEYLPVANFLITPNLSLMCTSAHATTHLHLRIYLQTAPEPNA